MNNTFNFPFTNKKLYKKQIKLKILIFFILNVKNINQNGDWGLGIGDWGLGIGDWAQSPIPNPQSPMKSTKNNKELINFV